jgi:uncharacterized protein
MAEGGIYDHVGGGFHRYAVDAEWLVPHFEKMLYDNAQLALTYLEAWQLLGDDEFARVIHETLSYLQREMTSREGGFFAATDADSPGPDGHREEGLFFTWTPDEVEAVVGERLASVVCAYFDVTELGNFEGRTVLATRRPLAEVARELGLDAAQARRMLAEAKDALYRARARRAPPLVDRKIVTAWNALAISAFARAGFVFGVPAYTLAALSAAELVLGKLRGKDGRLLRTLAEGRARHAGLLDDHAFMISALLDLYESTFEPRWLREAVSLQTELDARFWDDASGGYFFTPHDHEELLARDKPDYDGAEPAGNSVAAHNLLRLAELTGNQRFRERATALFGVFAEALARRGLALPRMLSALDFFHDKPLELVIVAPPSGDDLDALVAPVRRIFAPNRVLVVAHEGEDHAAQQALVPLLEGRRAENGRATAYVCRGQTCELPTSDPGAVRTALEQAQPL